MIVETAGWRACVLGDGRRISCGAVVLTTGTFLRGLIHIGETRRPAGRMSASGRRSAWRRPTGARRLRGWAA